MSFARFGPESDVYVFPHVDGHFECSMCALEDKFSFRSKDAAEFVAHLEDHRKAGHKVPEWTAKDVLAYKWDDCALTNEVRDDGEDMLIVSDYERWHHEALAALFPSGVPAMRRDLATEIRAVMTRLSQLEKALETWVEAADHPNGFLKRALDTSRDALKKEE